MQLWMEVQGIFFKEGVQRFSSERLWVRRCHLGSSSKSRNVIVRPVLWTLTYFCHLKYHWKRNSRLQFQILSVNTCTKKLSTYKKHTSQYSQHQPCNDVTLFRRASKTSNPVIYRCFHKCISARYGENISTKVKCTVNVNSRIVKK